MDNEPEPPATTSAAARSRAISEHAVEFVGTSRLDIGCGVAVRPRRI